jgi:glycosyltransferase involved in cell wall biosynthesis
MTIDSPLRINYWSPWSPDVSGIATYSSLLLPALNQRADVRLIHPDAETVAVSNAVNVRSPSEVNAGTLDGDAVDVFHFGNHVTFHHWMLAPLIRRGGIVVLHEWSLFDFMYPLLSRSKELWQRELRYNHVDVDNLHRRRQDPGFLLQFPMNRRVIESASVIVVHTEWLREKVLQHFSHKDVRVVPLAGVPLPSTPFSEDSPIVVLGGIGRHKQVSTVIAAFSQVARQIPNARLLIVGRADDPAEIRMLKKVVRRERLSKRVAWALNVNREKYLAHLASARCVVSLRPETAGEMSNVLVEAWGAGKVAITSDQPQFRTFDERYCRRVSLGDEAERDLTKELLATYTDPEPVRTGGQLARHLIDNEYSLPVVSEQYLNIVREVRTSRGVDVTSGVNVYGSWGSSTGLAEKSRRLVEGLLEVDVPLSLPTDFRLANNDPSLVPTSFLTVEHRPRYAINVFTANVNEFHLIGADITGSNRAPRWNIGLWIYEFPRLGALMAKRTSRVQEIWAGSHFAEATFRASFDGPIMVMPDIVTRRSATQSKDQTKQQFNLDPTSTIFFYSFDFASGWSRKNPLAVIAAYREAFGNANVENQLVLKVSQLPSDYRDILVNELRGLNARLIDEHISQESFGNLLNAIDVFVSLHRSEGFGLGMAESMALGKTVIGTRYSGNLDFMNDDNSLLVDYELVPLRANDAKANPGLERIVDLGSPWAEPNVDSAVRALRTAADKDIRNTLGPRAEKTISEHFSSSVVSAKAKLRLRELALDLATP